MDGQKEVERGAERRSGRKGESFGNSATIDLLIIRQLLTVLPCESRKYSQLAELKFSLIVCEDDTVAVKDCYVFSDKTRKVK